MALSDSVLSQNLEFASRAILNRRSIVRNPINWGAILTRSVIQTRLSDEVKAHDPESGQACGRWEASHWVPQTSGRLVPPITVM